MLPVLGGVWEEGLESDGAEELEAGGLDGTAGPELQEDGELLVVGLFGSFGLQEDDGELLAVGLFGSFELQEVDGAAALEEADGSRLEAASSRGVSLVSCFVSSLEGAEERLSASAAEEGVSPSAPETFRRGSSKEDREDSVSNNSEETASGPVSDGVTAVSEREQEAAEIAKAAQMKIKKTRFIKQLLFIG